VLRDRLILSVAGCSLPVMVSFADVETDEPEFAARVRAAFDAHGHKILATLRADGSPRVSGIEARFRDGQLWLAGMPRSVKFTDLRRDPRMALHSGSDEPDAFTADATVAGRAVEITDPAERAAFAHAAAVPEAAQPFELFRVDLEQVVLIAVSDTKDSLVISSWRPGCGLFRTVRT
jgi:Pyridoxamine 5'-phosphate oxidase